MKGRFEMSRIKIKPEKTGTGKNKVYKISGDPPHVAESDIVEILIPGTKGFSVYIPYPEVFKAQVFEAEKNPAWARRKKGAKGSVWGVQMTTPSGFCSAYIFPASV